MPLTTLGQETRWAYSTPPPSPHGAAMRWAGWEKPWASACRRTRVPGNFFTNIFFVTVKTRTGRGMEGKGERGEKRSDGSTGIFVQTPPSCYSYATAISPASTVASTELSSSATRLCASLHTAADSNWLSWQCSRAADRRIPYHTIFV